MPAQIYHKPVRELLRDMLDDWNLQPGQVFTSQRAVDWFAQRYPKLRHTGIRAHLTMASVNDPNRLHYSELKPSDDLLFKVASGQYRRYEAGKDPAPIHERFSGDVALEEASTVSEEIQDGGSPEAATGSSEFLLERDLQLYLEKNLECIEAGLKLYEDDGIRGFEFDAGGRRVDLLALDRNGNFVVIELKVSKGYDRVVGQLLRYMNWVRRELAEPGQRVRGIIVCRAVSADLRLACDSISDVELCEYRLSVTVTKMPALAPSGRL